MLHLATSNIFIILKADNGVDKIKKSCSNTAVQAVPFAPVILRQLLSMSTFFYCFVAFHNEDAPQVICPKTDRYI